MLHASIVLSVFTAIIIGSFFAAEAVEKSTVAQELVATFGYLGVLVIAVVAGLNALVPVPAATFVPIFLAGGLSMYLIIATLVAGTIIADLIGFYVGRFGSTFVTEHYPRTYERIKSLHENNSRWLPLFVFGYAAFIPFPNEAYLIPFGILGIPLRRFIVPVMLGATVYQTLASYGVENVFRYFF